MNALVFGVVGFFARWENLDHYKVNWHAWRWLCHHPRLYDDFFLFLYRLKSLKRWVGTMAFLAIPDRLLEPWILEKLWEEREESYGFDCALEKYGRYVSVERLLAAAFPRWDFREVHPWITVRRFMKGDIKRLQEIAARVPATQRVEFVEKIFETTTQLGFFCKYVARFDEKAANTDFDVIFLALDYAENSYQIERMGNAMRVWLEYVEKRAPQAFKERGALFLSLCKQKAASFGKTIEWVTDFKYPYEKPIIPGI